MPFNPKSLQNLTPGARKGVRPKATKSFLELLVSQLEARMPDVLDALDMMDPKDKVAAWTKLADRFMPKPEVKKEEVPDRNIEFVTILHGDEAPAPLLDIEEIQKNGYGSARLNPAPEATETKPFEDGNDEGVIDI